MAILHIEGLRYRYRQSTPWVLHDITWRVEPGEYVVLAGANGSGKSTLVRTCNGLIPHLHGGEMQGQVWVAGLNTREHPVHDLIIHVGIAFQNPEAQLFTSSVAREIAFGLESLGLPPTTIRQRIAEVAALLGIETLLSRPPHALSGGEQQQVVIAAALALQPQLLILDEPFAHLDAWHARRLQELLRRIHRQGITLLVVEHHLHHVIQDATRLVVLERGRIVFDGDPRDGVAEDLERFGVVEPPAVRWGRCLGLSPLPLTVEELATRVPMLTPSPLPRLSDRPSPSDKPVVVVEKLQARQGERRVLHDISLTVHAGECLAIVGPNGAGKTTLIRHLNGLLRPEQGTVQVLGQDVGRAKASTLARRVGMSFQNPTAQFFKPRVREELEVGPRVLGCLDPEWLMTIVRRFQLEDVLERSPYTLSEGEKRRLSFALAMAARPDVVILDEPTAGQDAHTRAALHVFLQHLRDEGRTVILATHDLDFAETCADRWAVLADGRLLAVAPPDIIMADPELMRRARLEPTAGFYVRQTRTASPTE